jgi:glycosyltransferase involved in cell wall biosynthesis
MKVLHITNYSVGGAGLAALRLHHALVDKGVQSAYLSTNLCINYKNEVVKEEFFKYKKASILKRIKTKLFTSKNTKCIRELAKINPHLVCEIATLPFSNYKTHLHTLVQETDVINLHWVSGIIDYTSFFKNIDKPIVWTLHDMNPFQGLFHYKGDQLKNVNHASVLDEKIKRIKTIAIKNIAKGATITPSKWLLEKAREEQFFPQSQKICIPNSIDLDVFKPNDGVSLRKKYGISKNEFVLLFIAESIDNQRKGLDLLLESLKYLNDLPLTILTVGKGKLPKINFKTIALGTIKSSEKMVECYSLADVFVLPSREDNLPNVMLESFACGTPLISFNLGGMKEHVIEGVTGLLAKDLTGKSLAKSIISFYNNKNNYEKEVIREYAEENFSFENQANHYLDVYNSLINIVPSH